MDKLEKLKEIISQYKSAVIAFSGGVDSTFLAWACKQVLNNNLLLVTATSSTYPLSELEDAKKNAVILGCKHQIIVSEELEIDGFCNNPSNRCYYCKKELFSKIREIAQKSKYEAVFDGSNLDDTKDYRPGRKALQELGIISPLILAGFTKEDIRQYSKQAKLPTAIKPSFACLASRFPYGEKITKEKLDRVGKAEEIIKQAGFTQFRVRSHGDIARLEFIEQEIEKAWELRKEISKKIKDCGFYYVAIDVDGYRTGSMNEPLLQNI
jgi:uncharacterized protein